MTWDGPPIDAWRPWTPAQAAERLKPLDIEWCVVGGWAIDLFVGHETRVHEDLEIAITGPDLETVRRHLAEFVFHDVGDGHVQRLGPDEPSERHQHWVLDERAAAWRVDVMVEPGDDQTWVYRRDERVRAPRREMVGVDRAGIPFLRPQAALLYKTKSPRPKDEADFATALPRMDQASVAWLRTTLEDLQPGHPWLQVLTPSSADPLIRRRISSTAGMEDERVTGAPDPRFAAVRVQAAYDVAADDYVRAFADDLAQLPVDRKVLDAALEGIPRQGIVLDLGCGPGQVGGYLRAKAATVTGVDLSYGMLRTATRREPQISLVQGDMRQLPYRSGAFHLVVAYYSTHHLPRAFTGAALREVARVLCDGGALVLATHVGEGESFTPEFLGHAIEPVGATFYRPEELLALIEGAGFSIEDRVQRDPLPHEHATRRIYVTAKVRL